MTNRFEFNILAPAEGQSSILEVSCEGTDILQVSREQDGQLIFRVLGTQVVISEADLAEISKVARDNLVWIDADKVFDM